MISIFNSRDVARDVGTTMFRWVKRTAQDSRKKKGRFKVRFVLNHYHKRFLFLGFDRI
jgi:hypothetical protein